MALDPSIILQAGRFDQPDIGKTLALRENILNSREDRAVASQQRALAQQKMVRLQDIGKKAAGGDLAGAKADALAAGDFDAFDHISKLETAQRESIGRRIGAAAPLALEARKLPYEQRRSFIASQADNLVANGWTPDELMQFDPTDQSLNGLIASSQNIKDILDRQQRADDADAQRRFSRDNALIGAGLMPQSAGGGSAPSAAAPYTGGPLTTEALRPHFVAQESGGNYKAVNKETGALGAYQVMPQTGQALAKQLGIPWRPDLMRSTTDEAKAYQDKIGGAAISEAIQGGGADNPNDVFSYYYGGSDRSKWGPRTKQYASEMSARLGSGESPGQALKPIPGGKLERQAAADARAEARDARAEAAAARAEASASRSEARDDRKITADRGKETMQLRKEFDALPEVKKFKTVRSAWQQVDAIANKKNPTAADDIAMIFSYMRMLDPDSVVREGEFATAQNAAGIPDRVANAYNAALRGNRLNPKQRQEFKNSAATVYLPIRDAYNTSADQYIGYARDAGIDPNTVARQYRSTRRPQGTLSAKPASGGWGKATVVQ